jgi:hypothetical protein
MSQGGSQEAQIEPSIYNDGDGIGCTLEFTPLLPSHQPGQPCQQKNAKAKTSTYNLNINKNLELSDVLAILMQTIKALKLNGLKYKIVGQKLRTVHFELEYSIPWNSQYKNIVITAEKDWEALGKQAAPRGLAKLVMHKTKVSH